MAMTAPTESGCLIWTGGLNASGRGIFWLDGQTTTARRASWVLFRGPFDGPEGLVTTCGDDLCVSLEHLARVPIGPVRRPMADRLEAMIERAGPLDCWPFMGTRKRFGYGSIRDDDGRMVAAHRAAWSLAHGQPVPAGANILHSCDNPPCCNPAHLRPGDQFDNMVDMRSRGRERKATRSTGNKNAKLTDAQVEEIRTRWVDRDGTQRALADEYHVDRSTVQNLVRGLKKRPRAS